MPALIQGPLTEAEFTKGFCACFSRAETSIYHPELEQGHRFRPACRACLRRAEEAKNSPTAAIRWEEV